MKWIIFFIIIKAIVAIVNAILYLKNKYESFHKLLKKMFFYMTTFMLSLSNAAY